MTLLAKIEAILFFKNEPVTVVDLSRWLQVPVEDIKAAIKTLRESYTHRGIVLIANGDEVALGTNPALGSLIEGLQKEELSRDIGRAGIETLSIILYRGPISRREIDYIRGINSRFILRNLLLRGLVERGSVSGEKSYVYRPTLELFKFLGITAREELPDYETMLNNISDFTKEDFHGTK